MNRTYKQNIQHTFMVEFEDKTTNEISNWIWITELEDLFDTEPKQDTFTIEDVRDYYMEYNSNGNSYLVDCINETLEQEHKLEIINITDIRD